MREYETVIGLEVHAELNTNSKIYCSCRNAFGLEVNTQVCPVCMGFPGTLPTLNKEVVKKAILMGKATNCKINSLCRQDRKNYFYPDLPKAYQISPADKNINYKNSGYFNICKRCYALQTFRKRQILHCQMISICVIFKKFCCA